MWLPFEFSFIIIKNNHNILKTTTLIINLKLLKMKTFALIVTAIATILYFVSTAALTGDSIGRSTKEGIHVFNFFFWLTIPIILWIIYFIRQKK